MNLKAALEGSLAIARAEALAATEKLIAEALTKEAAADECRTKIRLINDYRRGRI